MHWAAYRNHPKILETLLSSGADPGVQNKKGQRPADVASQETAATILLQHGAAEPNPELREQGPTIVPNYIQHPPFFYAQKVEVPASSLDTNNAMETASSPGTVAAESRQPVTAAGANADFGTNAADRPQERLQILWEKLGASMAAVHGQLAEAQRLQLRLAQLCTTSSSLMPPAQVAGLALTVIFYIGEQTHVTYVAVGPTTTLRQLLDQLPKCVCSLYAWEGSGKPV